MTNRILDVRGRKVELMEAGAGTPVLYLHDMWDVHTAQAGFFPFHDKLAAQPDAPSTSDAPSVGFTVRPMTDAERAELKVDSGVRVIAVNDGSEAQDKDIQPGDVIEEVNRVPVNGVSEFTEQVAKVRKAGKPLVLIVNRNGVSRFEALKLDK